MPLVLRSWSIPLVAFAVLTGSCAARDPRALSPADVAAGCSATTPVPCEAACFKGGAAACYLFGDAIDGSADPPRGWHSTDVPPDQVGGSFVSVLRLRP